MRTVLDCPEPPDGSGDVVQGEELGSTLRPGIAHLAPARQFQVPAYALDLLDQLAKAQRLTLMLAGGDQRLRERLEAVAEEHRALLRRAVTRSMP